MTSSIPGGGDRESTPPPFNPFGPGPGPSPGPNPNTPFNPFGPPPPPDPDNPNTGNISHNQSIFTPSAKNDYDPILSPTQLKEALKSIMMGVAFQIAQQSQAAQSKINETMKKMNQ